MKHLDKTTILDQDTIWRISTILWERWCRCSYNYWWHQLHYTIGGTSYIVVTLCNETRKYVLTTYFLVTSCIMLSLACLKLICFYSSKKDKLSLWTVLVVSVWIMNQWLSGHVHTKIPFLRVMSFMAGDTLLYGWRFEPPRYITPHVVPRKHFLNNL